MSIEVRDKPYFEKIEDVDTYIYEYCSYLDNTQGSVTILWKNEGKAYVFASKTNKLKWKHVRPIINQQVDLQEYEHILSDLVSAGILDISSHDRNTSREMSILCAVKTSEILTNIYQVSYFLHYPIENSTDCDDRVDEISRILGQKVQTLLSVPKRKRRGF